MTTNVKKILGSNKTFANHLGDEEAVIAQRQQDRNTHTPLQRQASGKISKPPGSRGPRTSLSKVTTAPDAMEVDEPVPGPGTNVVEPAVHPPEDELETNPFLASNIPGLPSSDEMEALLSVPPLSYNAARVAPTKATAPARQFCDICGFWGRVRCMKCGSRVCDLECLREHDATRCQKF